MIIDDLNFMGITFAPDEADPPPVVNPNGVLPLSITSQRLQLISWR